MAKDRNSPDTKLDWTQWVCPGPRRVFTADEMARAGQQPWPGAVNGYVLSNVVVLLAINFNSMQRGQRLLIIASALVLTWLILQVAAWLWRAPTRRNLNLASLGAGVAVIAGALVLRWGRVDLEPLKVPAMMGLVLFAVGLSSWWFLTIIRVQQIEARLRELAEQAHSLQLARRLATAQIQPHFLFNTLASIQHWVDTQDPRAGATLGAFTRYLRATLPMFERESLPLAEELQMVRSYLEVMQARLGERLRWEIDMAADVPQDLALPPGVLLTLVENAIVHGIEPSLRGGRVALRGQRYGGWVQLEVEDDGSGLPAQPREGVGLGNTRARLIQLHGEAAGLSLHAGPAGGAIARLRLPLPQAVAA